MQYETKGYHIPALTAFVAQWGAILFATIADCKSVERIQLHGNYAMEGKNKPILHILYCDKTPTALGNTNLKFNWIGTLEDVVFWKEVPF